MSTQKIFPSKSHSSRFTKGREINHIISEFSLSPEVQNLLKENQTSLKDLKIVVKNGEISLKIVNSDTKKQSLVKYETSEIPRSPSSFKVHIFKQFSSTILKDLGPVNLSSTQSGSIVTGTVGSKVSEPVSYHNPNINTHTINIPSKYKTVSPPVSKPSTPQLNKPAASSSSSSSSSASFTAVTCKAKLKPQQMKRLKLLLAIGPHSLRELSNKLRTSTPDVSAVIESVSQTYNPNKQFPKLRYLKPYKQSIEELYVLKYQLYQDLRLADFPNSISSEDMKVIKRNFEVIYNDVLKLDSRDPARVQLKPSKPSSPLSNPSPSPNPYSHHRKSPSSFLKPNASTIAVDSRKRKSDSNDQDYFHALAERFKTKYKEYERLYRSLNNESAFNMDGDNSSENLEKLFEMHKVLESWKSQLWKSVENA